MHVTGSARDRLYSADKKLLLGVGIVTLVAFVLLVVLLVGKLSAASQRSESYKDVSGAAGLEASISYNCTSACDQKFGFNVYIFREDGGQVGVFRPDKDGKVHAAFPEGNYIMLLGKQLTKDKKFPQEAIALRNGKQLVLKLQY